MDLISVSMLNSLGLRLKVGGLAKFTRVFDCDLK
jgi:hypothetical protein